MAYAFVQDVPIPWPVYGRIRAELGDQPPAGLVVHVVMETERGLRYLDVWESREAFQAFREQRLHPAVDRGLAQAGRSRPSAEPTSSEVTVREVWLGDGRMA